MENTGNLGEINAYDVRLKLKAKYKTLKETHQKTLEELKQ